MRVSLGLAGATFLLLEIDVLLVLGLSARNILQESDHALEIPLLTPLLGHRSPVVCRVYVFDEWTSDRGWSI